MPATSVTRSVVSRDESSHWKAAVAGRFRSTNRVSRGVLDVTTASEKPCSTSGCFLMRWYADPSLSQSTNERRSEPWFSIH